MDKNPKRRGIPKSLYVLLLVIYSGATLYTILSTRSKETVDILGETVNISSFTGVFSSIANICLILIVVFFGKLGFVTALVLSVLQFPSIFISIVVNHNMRAIPGFFANVVTIVAILIIYNGIKQVVRLRATEMKHLKEQQRFSQKLFEQTATALVTAIDAKDEYSHGHSVRVAEYSEKIAKTLGWNEEECNKVYYAALLHDVGKIGIDDRIINKSGKLTPEEYDIIKQHPVMGNQILSSIGEYPYLSIGAHYHHERYDGKGYPEGRKGEDIPEIARIISVADAYDAMTSNRSYRAAIAQTLVREEIVKGSGTQFDPRIAKIMMHLIDSDTEYKMKERNTVRELSGRNKLECTEFMSDYSDGINLSPSITRIHMSCSALEGSEEPGRPVLILFDALDGRVHYDDKNVRDMVYFEYGLIGLDGNVTGDGFRNVKTEILPEGRTDFAASGDEPYVYDIEAVKLRDHVRIVITRKEKESDVSMIITLALPDSSRYAYISIAGENCLIEDVKIDRDEDRVPDDYITRIAEEVSYIDRPEGDIPNVQVNGHKTDASKGIPLGNGFTVTFHAMSLPTARLIWHCPYISIYSSPSGEPYTNGYKEYALVRLDGEYWDSGSFNNKLIVNKNDDFAGWDAWKNALSEGLDCSVTFRRYGNQIITTTENRGLFIKNTTTINVNPDKVYVALTGDQCAITTIKITRDPIGN
ncbi:MAG: HD-GYP domain-containing protein [Lachnospiraceae bacterium]|nr:HD-GYP domain-containing protein [Lachnospiraceae bacterium]